MKKNVVEAVILFEAYGPDVEVLESPFYKEFWDMRMEEIITEGVCYSNSKIPDELCESLRKNIDKGRKRFSVSYRLKDEILCSETRSV